jgi:integrase
MILRLLYGCGLRLNEGLRLQVKDLDLQSGTLLIRNAKGNRDRRVPMDSSLVAILRSYVQIFRKDATPEEFLFSNRKNESYSGTIMRIWFNRVLVKAGIEKPKLPRYSRNICLHCIRHTFAVHSFRKQDLAGVDMYAAPPFLSAYMGHAQINGTETYLHMTAETGADVLKKTESYTEGLFPEVPQ